MSDVNQAARIIVCVLANDAVKGDGQYLDIGENTKLRIRDAVRFVQDFKAVTWAFGAGTDAEHRGGKTLATLSMHYLRTLLPTATGISNKTECRYYGTLEEIDWVVKTARERFSKEKFYFIFCTQPRHVVRVKFILRTFYPELPAIVEATGHVHQAEIPLYHELLSYLKLLLIKLRLTKRRYE